MASEIPLLAGSALPAFARSAPSTSNRPSASCSTEQRARLADRLPRRSRPSSTRGRAAGGAAHRLARSWSPISHLNAVMNSEQLRAATTPACRCCRSTTPTWRRARRCTAPTRYPRARRPDARRVQREVLEHALRDFRLAGVGLDAPRKARFKAVMMELSQLSGEVRGERARRHQRLVAHVTDEAQLAGINDAIVEQATARAGEGVQGWLFGARPAHLRRGRHRRRVGPLRRVFYEAWSRAPPTRGPSPAFRQHPVIEDDPAAAARSRAAARFPSYARVRAGRSHGAHGRRGHRLPAAAGHGGAPQREGRAGRARSVRGPQARRLGRHVLFGTPAAEPLFQVSQEELREYLPLPRVLEGLFEVAERLYGVRLRREAGRAGLAPGRSLLRSAVGHGHAAGELLPRSLRPCRTSAAARGWTIASAASSWAAN
jgi:oligopeptidase A